MTFIKPMSTIASAVVLVIFVAFVCRMIVLRFEIRELNNTIEEVEKELYKTSESLKVSLETSEGMRKGNDILQEKLEKEQTENKDLTRQVFDLTTRVSELETANKNMDEELKYYSEVCNYVYNGDWNANYDEEDLEILAGVMYGENYISGRWEMMLTGSVVLNRVLDPKFPNSIKEVVYQFDGEYEQYAPRTKRLIGSSEVTQECYDLAKLLLEYGPVAPPFVLYQAHFNQGKVYWEWEGEEFCYK